MPGGSIYPMCVARCLVPAFDGVIYSNEWKEALWDKFYTAAPRNDSNTDWVDRYWCALVNQPWRPLV